MELRTYQRNGARFLADTRRAILADAPGVGKTAQALAALREAGCRHILVVCPLSVAGHWRNQAREWGVPHEIVMVAGHDAASRRRLWRPSTAGVAASSPATLTIANYEAWRIDRPDARDYDAIVFDEAHRMKDRRTKTFKTAVDYCRTIPVVFLLTGTPVMNRPDELWPLLHLCDRKQFSSYWRWVREYCITESATFGGRVSRPVEIIVGLRRALIGIMHAEIRPYLLRRELREVVTELPEITYTQIDVTLGDRERQAYDQMAKRFFTELGGRVYLAPNEVTKITRLRQLVNAWEVLGASERGSKLSALVELVNEQLAGEQVVVFSCFAKVAVEAANAIGGSVGLITGDVSKHQRDLVTGAFAKGDLRVVIGTIGAMSEGIDELKAAHYCVFIDRDWTPARNEQAIARVHRYGQHDPVTVYDIVAADTMDASIAKALRRKESVIGTILGDSGA